MGFSNPRLDWITPVRKSRRMRSAPFSRGLLVSEGQPCSRGSGGRLKRIDGPGPLALYQLASTEGASREEENWSTGTKA